MELKKLDTRAAAERGFALSLVDANGQPTDITITVRGADSSVYRDVQRDQQRRRLAHVSRTRKVTLTPEEIDAEALELTVAATAGWTGIEVDGEPLAFSTAAAEKLYRDYPMIREQVDAAINDRSNFLQSAATA